MNFYSDNEQSAAQWLGNLIEAGILPPGKVDERSIADLKGSDLAGFEQVHLFAGVGGWPYALALAGWEGPVWTGSCPCQPFSCAGARKGTGDERHLWPEFLRLIEECRPPTIIGEQVASKDGREWLAGVRADLEALGYAVGGADLCAAGAGAPHIRQRVFWVADATGAANEQFASGFSETKGASLNGSADRYRCGGPTSWLAEPQHDGGRADVAWRRSKGRETDIGDDSNRLADAGRTSDERGLRSAQTLGSSSEAEGETRQRQRRGADAGSRRSNGRTADDASARCLGGVSHTAGGLGHTNGSGRTTCDVVDIGAIARPKQSAQSGFWDIAEWLPCLDGKARRVEPGTFPLAHGLPADMGSDCPGEASPYRTIFDPKTGKPVGQAPSRVGMLRGYGNAIVPQIAAAFVSAFMDVKTSL